MTPRTAHGSLYMAESSVATDSVEGSACSSPPVISSNDSSEKDTPVWSVSPLTPVSLLDKRHTPECSDNVSCHLFNMNHEVFENNW